MRIEDTISLEALNSRVKEGPDGEGADIEFTARPKVSLIAERKPQGAEIKGTIATRVRQSCARCLEPVERDLVATLSYYLQHSSRSSDALEVAHDIGVIFFEGDHVDLEDVLQEALILQLSPFWRPSLEKNGDCSYCNSFPLDPD
ncbi:MAG: DUF177 domain-containing protein, partial [Bdellovibrionales bacterium]|nr:DUF177 domain-containing protein [Bdellovibrionales bacterium]